jgi:hypothetical protein
MARLELFGSKPARVELLNKAAPVFFRLIQDSLWDDILLHIARLTDPPISFGAKANLTICYLSDLVATSETKAAVQALIGIAKDKSLFCRDWRNRRIAHRDLALALDSPATPLQPASRQYVREALSAIDAVLNAVSGAYMDSETYFERPGHAGGALSLLYVIDDGVRAEAKRRDRLKQGKWSEDDLRRNREL